MKPEIENHFASLRQQAIGENVNVQAAISSPLSFVTPIETVDLPSKGVFYPQGHSLCGKQTVEIKQMTAKEEDILTNKSFIKRGIVIDKLIESLLVDKTIQVSSLLIGDKNAIMVAARSAGYGPNYDVAVTCLDCGGKNQISVNLEEITIRDLAKIDKTVEQNFSLKHERMLNGNIVIKLPKSGWEVSCKLLNGEDEKKITALMEAKKRLNFADNEITISEQLRFIIDSISGITDPNVIKGAIDLMPAYDAKFLRTTYAKLIPNVAIEKHFTCVACSSEQDLEVPFTQEFFWPK